MITSRPVLATYREALENLGRLAWLSSSASRQRAVAPVWFRDLVVARGVGMLNLVLNAPDPWVVFPEVATGFAGVVLRKTPHRLDLPRPERLQVRYFHGQEALDMDHLVQNALAQLARRRLLEQPGTLRFADEHFLAFVFPADQLNPVLLRLGMPPEELAGRTWLQEGDVDWAAAGLG